MITSRHNPLLQRARAVRDGRGIESRALMFVEGVRLCEEAVAVKSLVIEDALFDENLTQDVRGARLLETLTSTARRVTRARGDVLQWVADAKTSQGVVLLAQRPSTDCRAFEQALEHRVNETLLFGVLHHLNNPSNAGAMLRVVEAAGAGGVIATRGSCDLFSPKTLRGAMGSAFRLPLWTGASFEEVAAWCKSKNIRTVGTDLHATKTYTEVDWTTPCAVVFGSEAHGLSASEIASLDERVKIPMRAPVESLNVAVAVGVILYEAARQREIFSRELNKTT